MGSSKGIINAEPIFLKGMIFSPPVEIMVINQVGIINSRLDKELWSIYTGSQGPANQIVTECKQLNVIMG